jgi:hypothetical protein
VYSIFIILAVKIKDENSLFLSLILVKKGSLSVFQKFAQQLAEQKSEQIFLKIVTKNVRKESVLKFIISADF